MIYKILLGILVTLICIAVFVMMYKYRKQIKGLYLQKKKSASNQLPQIKHTIYRPHMPDRSYEMETRRDINDYLEPMQVYRPTVERIASTATIYQEVV